MTGMGPLKAAIAFGTALVLVLGSPTDPVSAAEHRRQDLAARTLEEARAAAEEARGAASVEIATALEADPVADGEIVPDEATTIDVPQLDATVEFSGHDVAEPLDVTVSQLPGAAADTAEAESSGVAVSAAFEVSAQTAAGDDVSSFPADPTIEEQPDGSEVVTEVTPGVEFEIDVDEEAIDGLDRGSLRIMTRETAGEPWVEIPSYYDAETGTVKGEIDHLSQFVVIGTPFVPPPGPRIVLDPDDDVGHTVGPNGPMTELPVNVALANQLAEAMTEGCLADVVVTRTTASPAFLSAATRAGMAAAHNPNLTITLAFNANVGFPWGTESDGGSIGYSRGGAADNALRASLVAELPNYTGRPARGASSASYPYSAFDSLPGAMVHLETLFIDHNYDRPVIDNGFPSVVDGVFTGMGMWLESQGFDCTDPATGGWPARPSAADLEKWRNLGYQNFLTYGADPVSFSTGNLVEDEPIFALTGVGGQQTDITLVYNSQDGRLGRAGAGWTFGLGARAQRFDDGSVLVVRGDGASFVFEPNGTGGYDAEEGVYQTLTETGDGRLLLTAVTGESWLFDAADIEGIGELSEHTDRQGNTLVLGYATPDADDQFVPLASITDEAGQVILVGSDAAGRISSFTHPDGRVWSLGYDAAGDLVSITNPDSRQRTFTYDATHQMLTATDAAGITYLENEYDAAGRVVQQWDADGNLRTFDYDVVPGVGGETVYTDNEGNETVYRFDEFSRITEIEDALGGLKSYVYDDADQVIAFTDERGETWEYEYDADGNVVTESLPDGTELLYTYTPTGEVASVTDEGGAAGAARTTAFEVDARGLTIGLTRPDGAQIANVYDAHGDLVSTTDAAGGVTTFGYDARGNLTSSTDPLGRTTTFGYDAANRLTSATDAAGGVTTFAWDAGDRLVSQTDAAGGVTSFSYDANDHPLTRTDPDGAVTTYVWDALFRVVSITAPDGGETTFAYNTEDELVETTDALGNSVSLDLDDLYRPVTVTDPSGEEWERAYDPAGYVLSSTDPLGGVTTYAYDELGRMTSSTDALGGVTGTGYDEVGRLVAEVDAVGETTGYAYDVLDRLVTTTDAEGETEQYGYDLLGNLTTAVDRRGQQTTFAYDAASQRLSWSGPEGTGGSYGYDSRGNAVTATDALGRTVTTAYDALGRPVSQTDPLGATTAYGYDAMGRVVSQTDANGHVSAFEYDLAGRLTASIDPLGNETAYGYDLLGRPTTMTDAAGVVTAYGYDVQSRLTSVTEGFLTGPGSGSDVNVTTSYAYTETGNVASITDPLGAVTSFTYDLLGRTLTETNPLGKVWEYSYDALGRVTAEDDGKGQTTGYSYTDLGDVSAIDYASGADVTFEYDAAQNLIAMTDGLGASGWVYDDAGRLVQQTDSNGNVLEYGYDASGARTELELPSGSVEFEYDDAGRPVLQTSPWGSLGYAYDPAGNLTDVLRSTGLTSEYEYDAADRVTSITHTSPGSELGCDLGANDIEVGADIETLIDLDLCLTIDLDLPVLTGLDYGDSIELDYGYDAVGNVTSQTRKDGSAPAVATTYGYDDLHRLTSSASSDGVDNSYTFDKAGNRTQWVTDHAPDTNAALTVNATYNAAGQLTKEVKTRPGLLGIPSTATTNYTYDGNGNRTRMQTGSSVTDYTYTADDRLAEIDQGLREVDYSYDGLGRSLTEEVRSLLVLQSQTEQLWDGMVVVGQESAAGSTSLVRDVLGDVALQATPGLLGATDTRWGVTDRLGSTIGQGQGSKVGQLASYSDYGVPMFDTLGWNAETGYTGELGDTTAGLWDFYARSYDPSAGSWLQADPYRGVLDAPETLGRYAYVGGNPTTFSDAFGYRVASTRDGGGGGASRGVSSNPGPCSSLWSSGVMWAKKVPACTTASNQAATNPKAASNTSSRHDDWGPLLAVLDTVGTIAGFAAFIPGPQQPVLAAIAGIAGAATAFIRCATGGLLSPDCIIDVIFAALGPIGKGLKGVIGPIVKQALGGAATIATRAPTPAVVNRVDDAASCVAGALRSFSGDTEVLLADGSSKPIEDIEVGDEVLAADPVTGEQAAEEVTHLWVHEDDLIDLVTSAGVVTTTEDHPFWNATDQQWQETQELDAGDHLLTADGDAITVVGLDVESVREGTAYNLTVERLHTYHVVAGNAQILVHNDSACENLLARIDPANLKMTDTVAAHANDVTRAGNPARPFMGNGQTLTIQEIMQGSKPIPDPGGVPTALRWNTPGTLNGSAGTWELVVDAQTNTIIHYNFVN